MLGKLLGLLLGARLAGPFGALFGLFLGHMFDRYQSRAAFLREAYQNNSQNARDQFTVGGSMDQVAFAVGVIVLGAKMAKADGMVTREEINTFKRVFRVQPEQEAAMARLFDQARESSEGYESHAQRLASIFRARPYVLEELLMGLMMVAKADGRDLSNVELTFLRNIARIFGFSAATFDRLLASIGGPRAATSDGTETVDDPYLVLGLSRAAPEEQIKAAYRKLIREHHPDKLMAAGVPKEFIDTATERMKRINAAYDSICKQRNIR